MDTDELLKVLCQKLDQGDGLPWMNGYTEFGSYTPDDKTTGEVRENLVGPFLSISVDLSMRGTTMDQTTDRLSGDPYSAYVHYDWIGFIENAPKKATKPEQLDEWSIYNTRYVREYTDVGLWGVHSGCYVTSLKEDGTLTVQEANGRFQDVDPEELTTEKTLKLGISK